MGSAVLNGGEQRVSEDEALHRFLQQKGPL
jgi:hypothetical protein